MEWLFGQPARKLSVDPCYMASLGHNEFKGFEFNEKFISR